MPNLEYLEVSGSRADYGEFSGKAFPSLRTLCLRDMRFPPAVAAVYRSFSLITRLELIDIYDVPSLTEDADSSASFSQWPELRSIVFWLPSHRPSGNYSWLAKLISSRQPLTIEVPEDDKDTVLAIAAGHNLRFLTDEPASLITEDDFVDDESSDPESEYDDFSGSELNQYSDFSHELDGEDYFEDEGGSVEDGDEWYDEVW
ncbi:hypothetical protein B0H10DRAFT_968597 [Mycena sp. CBHHK59/15]|nr:hypothetical protein B0H10DRAFT_968597 [Mycena sp. CBHHK59/15]